MKTAHEMILESELSGGSNDFLDRLIDIMERYAGQFKPKWTAIEEQMPMKGFCIFWFTNEPHPVIWYNPGIKSEKWIENNKGSFWLPLPEKPQQ